MGDVIPGVKFVLLHRWLYLRKQALQATADITSLCNRANGANDNKRREDTRRTVA